MAYRQRLSPKAAITIRRTRRLTTNFEKPQETTMFFNKRILLVVSIPLSLFSVAIGLALPAGNRPRTEPVTGTFQASPVNVKQRVCTGEDGTYLEVRGKFAGTIASSDPR